MTTNEEALRLLEQNTDVKYLSVPPGVVVIAVEDMEDGDWLCFRVPDNVDLPELGTALIRTYVEATFIVKGVNTVKSKLIGGAVNLREIALVELRRILEEAYQAGRNSITEGICSGTSLDDILEENKIDEFLTKLVKSSL